MVAIKLSTLWFGANMAASQICPSCNSPSPCNEKTNPLSLFNFFAKAAPIATLNPWPKEPLAILTPGKLLWQAYFANTDVHTVREELKLNRSDVGWYQIRKALQARNASGDYAPVNFKPFEEAYKALTEKLQPMVYELGFLRV